MFRIYDPPADDTSLNSILLTYFPIRDSILKVFLYELKFQLLTILFLDIKYAPHMIDFWIFPLSTIWGAYQFTHFVEFFSFKKIGENHKEKSLVKKSNRCCCVRPRDGEHKES